MLDGWIKLHRKLLASDVFDNEKLLKVFIYCLLKCSHERHTQLVGRQTVELEPGQFVFGRKKASMELNMKESTVRDYMNTLKSKGIIDIKTTNKFSIVTVDKWAFYQSKEKISDNKSDIKPTSNGHQINTNKNDKNDKNDKNINTLCSKFKFETHHMKLAELLFKKMRENNPNVKQPNLESWANTFRLMMERDKREGKEIQDLILWSQQHHFWYKNILSAEKLRKQYDRLLLEMKDSKPNNQFKVINGGKSDEISQSSYREDYSRYDFTKGNEL